MADRGVLIFCSGLLRRRHIHILVTERCLPAEAHPTLLLEEGRPLFAYINCVVSLTLIRGNFRFCVAEVRLIFHLCHLDSLWLVHVSCLVVVLSVTVGVDQMTRHDVAHVCVRNLKLVRLADIFQ